MANLFALIYAAVTEGAVSSKELGPYTVVPWRIARRSIPRAWHFL
jgi:hypothetical protein